MDISPLSQMPQIIGIVNITRDSFSDGGRYLEPQAALAQARQLLVDGADVLDLGAESSHPDAKDVSDDEQIARLTPVLEGLGVLRADAPPGRSFRISVDTHRPGVMRHVLSLGADMINDITALRAPASVAAVRGSAAHVILMHSRSPSARARREAADGHLIETPSAGRKAARQIISELMAFFRRRIADLTVAGIPRQRLILDPGMGFFLSPWPEPSLAVLRELPRLRELGLPICVSTSRKSFIGAVLGDEDGPRPVAGRAAGTLVSELWAARRGAAYIRTHDVRALRDGLRTLAAISSAHS